MCTNQYTHVIAFCYYTQVEFRVDPGPMPIEIEPTHPKKWIGGTVGRMVCMNILNIKGMEGKEFYDFFLNWGCSLKKINGSI